MTDVNQPSEVEEGAAVQTHGPGRNLREAREARHLSVEQAAAQLRMQARIIVALENDDYSSLPGSTFVQGYLRSYARLLGLSVENIVAQAQSGVAEEPILVRTISEGKSEVSSRDLPFRLMSFLVLLGVVVGVGWWLSQQDTIPGRAVLESVSPQSESGGGEQGLRLPEEVVQPHTETVAPLSEGEIDAVADPASEVENVVESEESVEEVQPPAQPEVPVVRAPPVAVQPSAPPELKAGMPQSQLVLEYQADSWSEVTDAAGRQLTYGLIQAGESLTLHGEAPFKVFLGYATGVTIYYNDELYDHAPFQRGDVARFRIGRSEHNHPASR